MQPRIPEVTLLEELGRGPGSVVFRALHHGTDCTVKLPSDRPSALVRADAFEQDLLQLARLSRAGLPRVLQIGAIDDTSYAILDEADGEPLARALRRSIEEDAALQLAFELVASLRQLHDAGFIHGDLTLEHIVLVEGGTRINLLDRGSVARPAQLDSSVDTQALGLVLQKCVERIERPGAIAQKLMHLADELAAADRVDLIAVTLELEACASHGHKRNSYPPPGADALASLPLPISALAAPSRRARSELSQLQRAWERALSGQFGVVVGLLGAAGSGKSRLLAAFVDGLRDHDAPVLSVRCRNSDWAPFSALTRLLDGHLAGLAALEPQRREEIEASLRLAAGPLASRARLLSPRLAELFRDAKDPIGEGDAQQVFVAGMADFLAKYLEWSGRSLIVIDDVHWLDASSRLVLSRLAARLCPQGHVFVCGARDDAESREPLERFRAALMPEWSETLRLGSLNPDDAGDVIAEYLGLERAPVELIDQLAQLSDGTPLCLLELLRTTLETGLLKPQAGKWHLDAPQVQRMRLPASSQALIEQRLSKLDPIELTVLRAAAVLRDHFDVKLLASVTDLGQADVQHALDCAVGSRLLELDANGVYSFIHNTVWEALLRELPSDARRDLHQQVADVLFEAGGEGADYDYELARHYASGIVECDPARVFETNRSAARRAIEACDDVLALSFLKPAERAAHLAGVYPGRELFVQLAETELRTGDTKESLSYFERALVCSKPGFERAHVRGRMAWIHHFDANATSCRDTLEIALEESGRHYPGDHLGGVVMTAGRWAISALRDKLAERFAPALRSSRRNPVSEQEAQALCQLYTECFRVAFDSGNPFGVITSVLSLERSSRELQPCRAVVHADLLMALFFSTLGLGKVAQARFDRAANMASEIGDPIAQTLVHATAHAITGWRGDLAEAVREARICVEERGHWMELGELCHVCFALYNIETGRGRPEAALAWIDRAIERVRQNGRAPAIFALIVDAAIATLIALGREREIRSLERRLRFVEFAELQRDGYFHVLLYQTRVQRFTETGDFGPEFEALVDEFNALQLDPRRVHLLVLGYYMHTGHARLHQCLRAEPAARAALIPKLERACRDMELASNRIKNSECHGMVVRAGLRFFAGDVQGARALIIDAERIAERDSWPWVAFAASRLSAHMFRAEGNETAALDRAHVAAMWAQRYGQQSRLRVICEEFELEGFARQAVRPEVDGSVHKLSLDALLRISQANSRELGAERQARLILDELLEVMRAERALLFIRTSDASQNLVLAAGRRTGATDLATNAKFDRSLVDQVYATGQTQLLEAAPGERSGADRACIAVALVLREQAVGVLYLDRPEVEGSFRAEDSAVLQALASQVALALELGSTLREREQLQLTLQQSKTMEAVGRLAGGIAHDFNNIIAAIQFAASSLTMLAARGEVGHEDLADIQAAARRGADLTRQLLGLSRGKTAPPPPRRILLGEAVRNLLPMMRRLVRHDVRIVVEIASESLAIMADLSQIERVLMNLCQNASDAMPQGGSITIRVAPHLHDQPALAQAGTSHVLLTVADTGTGMTDEVRTRLFEPFFTTKANQRGTGLGLANVYAIVQQCQGTIEVTSELGVGSCFRITLPRTPAPEQAPAPLRFLSEVRPTAAANSSKTILVVDDDDAVRRMVVRTLELGGFRVLSAPSGEAALRIADGHSGAFNLVVTDMHMPPGMDGSQLGKTLLERDPSLKLLFLSGDEEDELEQSGLLARDAAFLHKPFAPEALLTHVREALSQPVPAPATAVGGSVG